MKRRMVLVPHCDKQEIIVGRNVSPKLEPWLLGDPPLSERGISDAHALVDSVCHLGPFNFIYCSRLQRAAQMAAVAALRLEVDFASLAGLGQHGSKNGSTVTMLPGHETENIGDWQRAGMEAIHVIAQRMFRPIEIILVMTHRPVLAGIAEFILGNTDPDTVNAAVGKWSAKPYVIVEIDDDDKITLVDE